MKKNFHPLGTFYYGKQEVRVIWSDGVRAQVVNAPVTHRPVYGMGIPVYYTRIVRADGSPVIPYVVYANQISPAL